MTSGSGARADSGASSGSADQLTHIDADGVARMVDVGAKPMTARMAVAGATLRFLPGVLAAVIAGDGPKGEVLGTARIAAVQAAKRTADLVPMCHPLRLDEVAVDFAPREADDALDVRATVRATDRTGVEMEALMAASTAALVIYDMTKALSKATRITDLQLLEKQGGKSGDWRRNDQE